MRCWPAGSLEADDRCHRCGEQGVARDTVVRQLAHEPFGWRPTTLLVTVCRYRCTGCGRVWRQDTTAAAPARAKISRAGLRWALQGLVVAAPDGGPVRAGARGRVGHRQRRGPGRRQAGADRGPGPAGGGCPCSGSMLVELDPFHTHTLLHAHQGAP